MERNEQGTYTLNGTPQYVSVRAQTAGAPLLLYLHGGPGDAALPLVLKYNRALERHFTVAVWEQRGAGKSYYPFAEGGVTIETFLQDLSALVQQLLRRFSQEKLYLVGHSWGSVFGLRFAARHPEWVRAYIGCGQVVNMRRSCRAAYEFALSHAGARAAERLRRIDCAYTAATWLDDLLFVTRQVVLHGGSLYGRRNYAPLATPFLFSRSYSLSDLLRRQKGSLQSIRALWLELMETNFEGCTRYGVPVVFLEGRHDHHVSSALAKGYFDAIQSEKQFFWFERSCHFPQWSEPENFDRLLARLAETYPC